MSSIYSDVEARGGDVHAVALCEVAGRYGLTAVEADRLLRAGRDFLSGDYQPVMGPDIECPECGTNMVRPGVAMCSVCETCAKYDVLLEALEAEMIRQQVESFLNRWPQVRFLPVALETRVRRVGRGPAADRGASSGGAS